MRRAMVLVTMVMVSLPGAACSTWAEDADLLCRSVEKWEKDERTAPDQRLQNAFSEFELGAGKELQKALRYAAATAPEDSYPAIVQIIRFGPSGRGGVPGWKCPALLRGLMGPDATIQADDVLAHGLAAELQPSRRAEPAEYKAAFLAALRKQARTPELKALLEEQPGKRAERWVELTGGRVNDQLRALLD